MKKLMLLLALSLGISSSFVSCRDTTEDVDDVEVQDEAEDVELEDEEGM